MKPLDGSDVADAALFLLGPAGRAVTALTAKTRYVSFGITSFLYITGCAVISD